MGKPHVWMGKPQVCMGKPHASISCLLFEYVSAIAVCVPLIDYANMIVRKEAFMLEIFSIFCEKAGFRKDSETL